MMAMMDIHGSSGAYDNLHGAFCFLIDYFCRLLFVLFFSFFSGRISGSILGSLDLYKRWHQDWQGYLRYVGRCSPSLIVAFSLGPRGECGLDRRSFKIGGVLAVGD